jgi:hypothetical protein
MACVSGQRNCPFLIICMISIAGTVNLLSIDGIDVDFSFPQRSGSLNAKCVRAGHPFPGCQGLVAVCSLFSGAHVVSAPMKKVGHLFVH